MEVLYVTNNRGDTCCTLDSRPNRWCWWIAHPLTAGCSPHRIYLQPYGWPTFNILGRNEINLKTPHEGVFLNKCLPALALSSFTACFAGPLTIVFKIAAAFLTTLTASSRMTFGIAVPTASFTLCHHSLL